MTRFLSILILLATLCAPSLSAKNVVIDASVGRPVPGATLFTSKGLISTTSDSKGRYTAPSVDEYPILVRALGFENLRVESPVDTIRLTPKPIELAEVTATPASDRNVIYVRAYIREYQTVIIEGDSLKSLFEGNVDYFLADEKVKGFKDSRSFRLLYNRARIEDRKDGKKTVTEKEGVECLFSPVVNMLAEFPKPIEIPADLRGRRAGSEADKAVWGSTRIFTKGPEGYTLTLDPLADKELHDWSPAWLKLLGMTSTFTQLTRTFKFGPSESGVTHIPSYCIEGFSAATCFVSSGKLIKKACHTDEPVEFLSYIEVLPYQIDFLTADEAKKLRKQPVVMREVFVPEKLRPASHRPEPAPSAAVTEN